MIKAIETPRRLGWRGTELLINCRAVQKDESNSGQQSLSRTVRHYSLAAAAVAAAAAVFIFDTRRLQCLHDLDVDNSTYILTHIYYFYYYYYYLSYYYSPY